MNKTHWLVFSDNKKHPYHLVASRRAKYVRVKLSRHGELSVVLPYGVDAKHAHEFLKSRSDWVRKHLKSLPEQTQKKRPDYLYLGLLDEMWSLHYCNTDSASVELKQAGDLQLSIIGNTRDLQLLRKVILMWCKQKARDIFNPLLQNYAEEHGFFYKRLTIRAQKTRWGSCSSDKNINLNCKLLFMPPEIVRYVMIHELCHTIEMNHSQRFWSLVEECDPLYKQHRKQLKETAKDVFSDAFWS